MEQRDELQQGESSTGSVLGVLRPYSGRLFFVIALLSLLAVMDLAPPYAIKLLIDDVFSESKLSHAFGSPWGLLGVILAGLFLSYILRNALFYSSRMQALRTSEDICFSLRKRLFDHLQQLSLRFYRSNQPGRVGARVMDDTYKIQTFIQDKFPILMLNLVKFQILIVVICVMNIRLALASIIILPLQFVTYRFFRAPIKHSHSEAQENLSLAYGSVVEKFLGIEVVKGFSAEARESATFREAINETRRSQIKSQRYHFAQKVTADLLVGLGTIMLLAYGASEVIKGRMKSGEFMMFFGYVMMLYPSILEIISGVGHSSKATASVSRVFDMLDEPIHDTGVGVLNAKAHSGQKLGGDIEFEHVRFAYDEPSEVLQDISFSIRSGERVAVTGVSGSGKSTMINLLPRFITPIAGTIRVGGEDTAKLPIQTIRSAIGIAFQEVFLFNATIDENLRYARENAKREDVERVCRLTGADEVIARLPKGYDTRLSDFGVELSRGEKQRITLSRALLKDAPILIFDEVTASIDRESSRKIMETIFATMLDQTILMVTHEAYLLDMVDRVLCIQDGRICFNGSPSEYMTEYMPMEFGQSTSMFMSSELPNVSDSGEIGDEHSPISPDESRQSSEDDDISDGDIAPDLPLGSIDVSLDDIENQCDTTIHRGAEEKDRRRSIRRKSVWTKETD